MKKFLIILSLFLLSGIRLFAQEDDNDGNEKIRDKMTEFIQKRMNLTKSESEKFAPVFLRYFREWRQTLRESKGLPGLDRQQKIIELRLRYRNDFKVIVGENRSNEIYRHQDIFIRELQTLRKDRLENIPTRRFRQ